MKTANFSDLDVPELQRRVQDAQENLFRLRFQIGMGQGEGLKKYRSLKKDRARMLTELTAKGAAPLPDNVPAPAASAPKGKAAKSKGKK
jgi:large subunit ribosomal protein L29